MILDFVLPEGPYNLQATLILRSKRPWRKSACQRAWQCHGRERRRRRDRIGITHWKRVPQRENLKPKWQRISQKITFVTTAEEITVCIRRCNNSHDVLLFSMQSSKNDFRYSCTGTVAACQLILIDNGTSRTTTRKYQIDFLGLFGGS